MAPMAVVCGVRVTRRPVDPTTPSPTSTRTNLHCLVPHSPPRVTSVVHRSLAPLVARAVDQLGQISRGRAVPDAQVEAQAGSAGGDGLEHDRSGVLAANHAIAWEIDVVAHQQFLSAPPVRGVEAARLDDRARDAGVAEEGLASSA